MLMLVTNTINTKNSCTVKYYSGVSRCNLHMKNTESESLSTGPDEMYRITNCPLTYSKRIHEYNMAQNVFINPKFHAIKFTVQKATETQSAHCIC
jgi:hypothetical protein